MNKIKWWNPKIDVNSKSQISQDEWVLHKLNYKKNGFYLDIGAFDGEYLSNTYILDKDFDWKGICIDPFPKNMENRSCTLIKKVIFDKDNKVVMFTKAEEFGGITSEIERHKNRDIVKNANKIKIKTITLRTLFKNYDVPKIIDYLSIDTEGSEYEILKSFPWDKHTIKTITVEHNFEEEKRKLIKELLESKGFKYEGEYYFDDFYVNKDL